MRQDSLGGGKRVLEDGSGALYSESESTQFMTGEIPDEQPETTRKQPILESA